MPSVIIVSSVTKGEQMVPILNALDVNTAVFGNHDFGMYVCMSMYVCMCMCVYCLLLSHQAMQFLCNYGLNN